VTETRRLRRDARANRQRILEAAGHLMAEHGLTIPLEDIAADAGVGIGTLYRRFPHRDDLVEALFEDRLAAYVADLETAVAMPDGWDALVWCVGRSATRQLADRALSELIEHSLGPGPIRQLREQVLPLVERLVDHARASGRLRPDFTVSDLVLVQRMLVSVGTTTAPESDTAWRRYLTILLDGMVTRRSEPTAMTDAALTVGQLKKLRDDCPATSWRRRQGEP